MPSQNYLCRSLHSKLLQFLSITQPPGICPPPGLPPLPPAIHATALAVYNTTTSMTKTSSHIRFLDTCLRSNNIPNGFKLKFNLQNPCPRAFQQAATTCKKTSRKLMTIQLNSLRQCHTQNRLLLDKSKRSLLSLCTISPPLYTSIIQKIRDLNNELYQFLTSNKQKKLDNLNNLRPVPLNVENNTVVTIPCDLHLSDDERRVLSKGLTFIPEKPTPDRFDVLHDLEAFYRRLRLKACFFGKPPSTPKDTFETLNPKDSAWSPTPGHFPALDLFINICRQQVNLIQFRKSHHKNTTPAESQALTALKKRTDIVIKPADKGGAIVVWQKDLYLAEANKQLNNPQYYSPLQSDPTASYQNVVKSTIETAIANDELPETAERLVVDHPRTACFYMLPKIHKAGNPGRPIVSACSCPTTHISAFLDSVFQTHVSKLPTYIKDTNHALNIIENLQLTGIKPVLFTLDITSLYTVIPHADGLNAVKHFLNKRTIMEPPTDTLLRLTELVLTLNGFAFEDKFYQQKCGVAMGTKMGPSYANLFVGWVEECFFSSYTGPVPDYFGRFIDDCLGVNSSGLEDAETFICALQTAHPSLKYTKTVSDESVAFLDITITTTSNNKLNTSVHYKPTDSHNYLSYSSSHPAHTKNAIPYSQLLRLRRLCSDDADFNTQSKTMCQYFRNQNYPENVIQTAQQKTLGTSRRDALKGKDKNPNTPAPIPLVLTFHPTLRPITDVILKNFAILRQDDATKAIFTENPLISYRRDNNIRDLTVHSRSQGPSGSTATGTFPCKRPRCVTCAHVHADTLINGPLGKFTVTSMFSCISTNLIYCISCSLCPGILYIGETKLRLGDRFRNHLFTIRHNTGNHVSKHFNLPNHSVNNAKVCVLRITNCKTHERRRQENKLIFKLGTEHPRGLNELLSFR